MANMEKKYYALVRWIGGEYDKTHTPGVPTDWIKDFDVNEFLSANNDPCETYVLEWREKTKKNATKKKYELYDVHVIRVSDNISRLEDYLTNFLEGKKSPMVVPSLVSNTEKGKNIQPIKQRMTAKRLFSSESEESDHGRETRKRKITVGLKKSSVNNTRKAFPSTNRQNSQANKMKISVDKARHVDIHDVEGMQSNNSGEDEVSPVDKRKKYSLNRSSDTSLSESDSSEISDRTDSKQDGDDDNNDDRDQFSISQTLTKSAPSGSGKEHQCSHGLPIPGVAPEREISPASSVERNEITINDIWKEMKRRDKKLDELCEDMKMTKKIVAELEMARETTKHNNKVQRPRYSHNSGENLKNSQHLDDGEFIEGLIEIGEVGSGITVTDTQWTTAISTGSYKFMATQLVMSLFSLETLLKSNYKGGENKHKKRDGPPPPQFEGLDERIVNAVKYSVRRQYPQTYTAAGLGAAINCKLVKLRGANTVNRGNNGPSSSTNNQQ